MRKEYNGQQESFVAFSASLEVGDTAIFGTGGGTERLAQIEELLRRGVVVRTPSNTSLDTVLVDDRDVVQELLGWVVALQGQEGEANQQKTTDVLEAKVHRLVVDKGLGVVAACRKVHCRPSAYYIYRAKEKRRSYGR